MSVIAISPAHDTSADGAPLLRWMIFTGACAFAVVLLWQYGLIHLMVVSDRTYISSIIAALYVVASLHCLWRTIAIGREGDAARRAAGRIEAGKVNFAADAGNALPDGLIADHIRDLVRKARTQGAGHLDQTLAAASVGRSATRFQWLWCFRQ